MKFHQAFSWSIKCSWEMLSEALGKSVITATNTPRLSRVFTIVSIIYNRQLWAPKRFLKPHWSFDKTLITHIIMHKSLINFKCIGKYTNWPEVSFSCRFVLLICREDFSGFKTLRKNTNGETIIIVIRYNWSKNIAKFLNCMFLSCRVHVSEWIHTP